MTSAESVSTGPGAGRPAGTGAAPFGAGPGPARPGVTARDRRRRLVAPLTTGAVVAAATGLIALRDPHQAGSYGLCPSLVLTGLACPACGGLRATYDLAHLDLAGAWATNMLWVVLVPVLVALWVAWTVRAARGLPAPRVPVGVGVAGLVVLVAFAVARNLPPLVPYLTPWLT